MPLSDVSIAYSWRLTKNRTAQNGTGSGTCFQPQLPADTNNRILGATYDASGNLLNDGNHTYAYDAENRITQVDGGTTATRGASSEDQRKYKITIVDRDFFNLQTRIEKNALEQNVEF